MIITHQAFAEFKKALYGQSGDFDAWLECNNEEEVRAFIKMLVHQTKEDIADWVEPQRNDLPATGEEFVKTINEKF